MKNRRISRLGMMGGICLLIPLLILTTCTIIGEGITFESVSASIGARRALSAIKAGDYQRSARYIDFWGFNENRTMIDDVHIEAERQRYIEGLEAFFDNDMSMGGYEILNAVTDDGMTIVTSRIVLVTDQDTHHFILRWSKENGRLCPMGVVVEASDRTTAVIADAFINIIHTYYPG